MDRQRIGLLAGHLDLPVIWAKEASRSGYPIFALALTREVKVHLLKDFCEEVNAIPFGELETIIATLKRASITQVVMVGMVPKEEVFGQAFDGRLKRLLNSLPDFTTDVLLDAIVKELKEEGITLFQQTSFLQHLLAGAGPLTKDLPGASVKRDMEFGFQMAKGIGALDIGQTVVVKKGTVIVAEAIEGTDLAIERAASLVSGGVVAKVAKPGQDFRFDVPIVGLKTLAMMRKGKMEGLVLEADKVLILEKEDFLREAEHQGISVYGMRGEE